MSDRVSWRERAASAGYAAGWHMVRTLPERPARVLFDGGADYVLRDGGPVQLRGNLARVLGCEPAAVPGALLRASMHSYARYWREAFRLPSMDHAALVTSPRYRVYGRGHLDAALAQGRGVILALPHSGNWDMAGVWLVQHYGTFATVAERLRPESLFTRFSAYREGLGFEVFPLTGGEQPPYHELAARLRANGIVCLLSERDLTRNGVPVRFFGEQARFPAGPARLAGATGATLLPVHAWFTGGAAGEGWGLKADPPVDVSAGVTAATQALADQFARNIAAHPGDWHMLQPLWDADRAAHQHAQPQGEPTPR